MVSDLGRLEGGEVSVRLIPLSEEGLVKLTVCSTAVGEGDQLFDRLLPYESEIELEEPRSSEWGLEGDPSEFVLKRGGDEVVAFSEAGLSRPDWVSPRIVPDTGEDWVTLAQRMGEETPVYGLGERTGRLDKGGSKYESWNVDPGGSYRHNQDPLYLSVPFYLTRREGGGWLGVFLARSEPSWFDVGSGREREELKLAVAGERMDLFLFAGEDPAAVLNGFTELTGRAALPPKWALGYHHSKYGVPQDEEEALDLVREFRERDIPCDALYMDIQHMEERKVFSWDPDRFPRPEEMIEELHELNCKVVNIVDPGMKIEEGYEPYESGKEEGVFVENEQGDPYVGSLWPGFSHFPDFLRKGVRDWWAERNEKLLEEGADGIWNDMNEPAVFFGREELGQFASRVKEGLEAGEDFSTELLMEGLALGQASLSRVVHETDGGESVPHRDVHNLYALYEDMATERAFRKHDPERRPFILSRSGFAGVGKYAAVWTGDNSSSWEHLRASITMALNMGLSGLSFVGADVGGFEGDAEPELFTRWVQLGATLPFFRNHSSLGTAPQEPWSFGEELEEINRDYIRFRYRLLPYLYTLLFQAKREGTPVVRPLFWEFPDDERTYPVEDQFMLGDALMVAPVCEKGMRERPLYLPRGKEGGKIRWQDWWSGQIYESGRHFVEAPLDRLPLFLREGKGVPLTDPAPNVEELSQVLYLRPGPFSEAGSIEIPVYDDDGESRACERGEYFLARFLLEEAEGEMDLSRRVEREECEPFWEEVRVED